MHIVSLHINFVRSEHCQSDISLFSVRFKPFSVISMVKGSNNDCIYYFQYLTVIINLYGNNKQLVNKYYVASQFHCIITCTFHNILYLKTLLQPSLMIF